MVGGGGTSPSAMGIGEKGKPGIPSPQTPKPTSPAPWSPARAIGGAGPSPSGRSWTDALNPPRTVTISDAELRSQFIEFLDSYTLPGAQTPAYEDQVHNLWRVGRLDIHFEHLLESVQRDRKHKKFLNLVLRIGNEANDSWLDPAAQQLISRAGHPGNVPARVAFMKKPKSISRLQDFLTDKGQPTTRMVSVLIDNSSVLVYAATTHGRTGFRIPLLKLLSCFYQDQWFEDDLTIEDFLIIESEFCYILQKPYSWTQMQQQQLLPQMSATDASNKIAASKAKNLASLWTAMEGFFIKNGKLPIFFEALKTDLLIGTLNLVKKAWFLRYLANHFALGSSMCRKLFTNESYQVCKTYTLGDDPNLKSILKSAPRGDDWRLLIALSNDYILNRCFWHGVDLDGEFNSIAGLIESGEFHKISRSEYEKARANTVEAALEYKRHLLTHLEEHFKKQMEMQKLEQKAKVKGQLKSTVQPIRIKDFDDIELFASGKLPEVEPMVLKKIMEKNMQDFESLLSIYEVAMSDKRDLPRR